MSRRWSEYFLTPPRSLPALKFIKVSKQSAHPGGAARRQVHSGRGRRHHRGNPRTRSISSARASPSRSPASIGTTASLMLLSLCSARKAGIRALYRGFVPTMCGMVPCAGFSFYCFESLKFLCMKYMPTSLCRTCERNIGGLVLTVPAKLVCGVLAGAVAQSVSYPLDVTRRRMQLACMDPHTAKFGSTGMVKTLTLIYRENGIVKGLYRGMSINYIRAIPMVATSFSTYELMKQLLQLDTGMKVS